MNINIDVSDFTEQEIKFLNLLVLNQTSVDLICEAREKASIPKEGLIIGDKLPSKLSARIIGEYAYRLAILHKLDPIYWLKTFTNIIAFSEAIARSKQEFDAIELKKIYGTTMRIEVREMITVNQLIQFIKNNSEKISSMLSNLPKPRAEKVKNVEVKQEIIKLYNKGLTDKQIGVELNRIYDDTLTFDYGEETIRTERVRFLKLAEDLVQK